MRRLMKQQPFSVNQSYCRCITQNDGIEIKASGEYAEVVVASGGMRIIVQQNIKTVWRGP